eukprot:2727329-Amphidinium_carterae.1
MSTSATGGWKDRDPPPTWDGESPELRWRATRRALVLWSEDTEVPKARQGLRFYRSLQGKAATMAELMEDNTIRGDTGFQNILTFFDNMYTHHLRMAYDQDFDKALYSGARAAQESCLQYAIRKRTEMTNFELHHEPIGEMIKGKVLLRHARLDNAQLQRVHTWIKSDRTFTTVFEALVKLDTELDSASSAPKAYWTDEPEEQREEDYPWDAEATWGADTWWQHADEDWCYYAAEELYGEKNDEGEDSESENIFWMHPETLAQPLDEYTLDQTFATFAEGKGKKGYSNKGKGGKSKGKGKDKNKADGGESDTWTSQLQHRWHRDQRRQQHKYVKTTRDQLNTRVRCWRCQQIGHIAAQCPTMKGQGGKGASKSHYFVTASADSEVCTFELGFQEQDSTWLCLANWSHTTATSDEDIVYGVIDTGASGGPQTLWK